MQGAAKESNAPQPVLDVDKMRMKVSALPVVKLLTGCSFAENPFSDIAPVSVKKPTSSEMVRAFFFLPPSMPGL